MLILHFSTDLYFLWQARLLPVGAHLNTARSDGRRTACGRSRRSDRPVRHRRSACTDWDMPPHTVPAVFERGIMRLDFNGFAGFVKIDAGCFLPLGQSGFHIASISACSAKQAHFQDFLSALHLQNRLILHGERPGDTLLDLDAPT